MTMGAAWGMEYLHKCSVLHRDIAARNCLYDKDKIVKISDFGLSRRGSTYKMQTAKKMPIKWMAPESMTTFMFSQKTDVYSYGVSFFHEENILMIGVIKILVYEIFSGAEPYEGISNSMTKKMVGQALPSTNGWKNTNKIRIRVSFVFFRSIVFEQLKFRFSHQSVQALFQT
ncbi:unnamed protein product [Strongylus vulgaris]|uniref:Protein kinase domain-containing protein n=1 Tax=Strongylus vulgaris TaxID=40348 RepID=A0A3P7LGW8_STRVU|nr:unnamed protein product [Strongylus vulgaris]